MQKLANNLYVQTGHRGVTVGALVTREGVICIDTPTFPADARKWRLRLAQLSSQPVRFIVNTDHHRDRILGNQWFDAPVIAHAATAERVHAYPEVFKSGLYDTGGDFEAADDLGGVRFVPPQMAFTDKMILHHGGREIHLLAAPGAAPGSAWVHFPEEDILFTGDTVVVNTVPVLADADVDRWIERLTELRKPKHIGRVIVPGRGPVTDKDGAKPTLEFVKRARRKVQAFVEARKPRADIFALVPDMLALVSFSDGQRDLMARRVRAGLEHLYDEIAGVPPQ